MLALISIAATEESFIVIFSIRCPASASTRTYRTADFGIRKVCTRWYIECDWERSVVVCKCADAGMVYGSDYEKSEAIDS